MPTPIVAGDLVIVTGGWPNGGRPIYAIRAATGEVAWKLERGSPYTPTPIVYDGVLYVCVDTGVLSAYDVATGPPALSAAHRARRGRLQRLAGRSRRAACTSRARTASCSSSAPGGSFELLARNDMREMCLATPALSGDMLLVRTRTHVHALREAPATAAP